MAARSNRFLQTAVTFGLGVFGATSAAAAGMSVRTLGAQETKLATIEYRIATANSGTCRSAQMLSGLVVHELTQYPRAARASVANAFSLHEGVGVLGIVPGSGAERAGLRIDDEILAVGDASTQDSSVWNRVQTSYDRIDSFQSNLSLALTHGPVNLAIRRGGDVLHVQLRGDAGCGGNLKFVDSAIINAWSDGRHVVLNRGIVDLARSDDQLAFIIAHEMAHNILGHSKMTGASSRGIFGQMFKSVSPRSEESQADIAAVNFVQAAGYDPQGGLRFLEIASKRLWWASLSFDHPSFGSRARTVAMAIANRGWQMANVRAPATKVPLTAPRATSAAAKPSPGVRDDSAGLSTYVIAQTSDRYAPYRRSAFRTNCEA